MVMVMVMVTVVGGAKEGKEAAWTIGTFRSSILQQGELLGQCIVGRDRSVL